MTALDFLGWIFRLVLSGILFGLSTAIVMAMILTGERTCDH
jgi:hypothetical protein